MKITAYNHQLYWVEDGRIAVIRGAGDMSRLAIDDWARLVLDTLYTFPTDRPICILNDLTHPDQGFTPYAQERVKDLYRNIPQDRPIYSAIVLRDGFINRIISIFVRRWVKPANVTERIFLHMEEALEWLKQFCVTPTV